MRNCSVQFAFLAGCEIPEIFNARGVFLHRTLELSTNRNYWSDFTSYTIQTMYLESAKFSSTGKDGIFSYGELWDKNMDATLAIYFH